MSQVKFAPGFIESKQTIINNYYLNARGYSVLADGGNFEFKYDSNISKLSGGLNGKLAIGSPQFSTDSFYASNSNQIYFPNASSDTLAVLSQAQTLSNKTLSKYLYEIEHVSSTSSPYTIPEDYKRFYSFSGAADIVINLPTPILNRPLTIMSRIDGYRRTLDADPLTIGNQGTSIEMDRSGDCVGLICLDGTNWHITNNNRAKPYMLIRRTLAQTIPTGGSGTKLLNLGTLINSVRQNENWILDLANGNIVFKKDGYYLCTSEWNWDITGNTNNRVEFWHSFSSDSGFYYGFCSASCHGDYPRGVSTCCRKIQAATSLSYYVRQDTGSGQQYQYTGDNQNNCEISIVKLSDLV